MRKAPESNELDNPLLADRIGPKDSQSNYRVPQDIVLENKHKQQMETFSRVQEARDAPTAVAQKRHSEPAAKVKAVDQQENLDKSKEKMTKDRSTEDLSQMSSHSKAQ
jgi:hypothetical protein